MLIIREDKFVQDNEDLYIVGSANMDLYRNNVEQMSKIQILGYLQNKEKFNLSALQKMDKVENCEIHLYPENLSWLKKISIIKEEIRNCDCVCLKMTLLDAYWGCHYAIKFKKPFVIESGTWAWGSFMDHGNWLFKFVAIPLELLARYYHKKAKYIVYVSRFYLQKFYKSSAKQLGCPDVVLKDTENIVLEKRIAKIRAINPEKKIVLGLIGQSHVEYRGHDTLIEVASILTKEGYNIEIRFLGGGNANDKRMKYASALNIADKVFFEGYKSHDEVLKWLDDIDILVMPTLQETLGRSILEAMSRGCPVIGSKETAIGEQVGSDCLASARDVKGIVRIIKKMIDDKYYMELCAYENFYRAKKYCSSFSNAEKKKFYDMFYKENNITI